MIIDKVKGGYKKRGFLVFSWSLLKRIPFRDAFFYEKSLKTDIYAVRFALIALFSRKNECFSSTNRAFDFFSGKNGEFSAKNFTLRA
jgi:hypothetical protein